MSPRRLRSASNPPRSPSHSSLASASSAFAASSTAASLRSHRSASHATSPPRSSKRVTHMLDRPSIAGYSITFAPPSPSLPSVKPTSRSSPPSSSSTPARPSYRISSLVPPSPSPSSSSSLPSPSVSMSSSSLLPAWHLPRLSIQATLLPSSSTSSLHSLYPHTSLSSPPSLVAAASDRRYTIGAAGDEYECPRCHGHKGQGPFGPCPLGSIHFTHMCELCEGRGSVAGTRSSNHPNAISPRLPTAALLVRSVGTVPIVRGRRRLRRVRQVSAGVASLQGVRQVPRPRLPLGPRPLQLVSQREVRSSPLGRLVPWSLLTFHKLIKQETFPSFLD